MLQQTDVREAEADEGVGRGPGGPPHAVNFFSDLLGTRLDTDPGFAVTPNGVCHLQQIVGWLNRIPLIDI